MSLAILRRILVAVGCAASVAGPTAAAERLAGYNADIGESSISGISSGADMAVQFGTAWSSLIKGVGVVAGAPYFCAKADSDDFVNGYTLPIFNATGPCMAGPPPDLGDLWTKAEANAKAGAIDPLDGLGRQKIYVFHGYNDAVVARSVTDATVDFYRHYLGDGNRGNLFYQTAIGAGHSLVIAQAAAKDGLNNCQDNTGPYIDACGYDQAGIILQHIYGALNPPNRGTLAGKIKIFEQSAYTKPDDPGSLSLGPTGYVFVPSDCDHGAPCRVHIALHGCKQDFGDIDRRFVDDTGYNAWADTNHLIVLYPQTVASPFLPSNPQACWDWWSYVDHADSYVTKSGAQIRSLKAMLDALTSGANLVTGTTPAAVAAPAAVAIIDSSDTAVDLAWTPQSGTMAYRVWRAGADGSFAAVGDVASPGFADTGLSAATAYRWRVTARVDDVEGPASAEVTAATRAAPPPCAKPGDCPVSP